MLGTCPICLEGLTAVVEPTTMPCGHLYCLACASFWFHQGDAPQPCVICRKNFTGGDIIKLWLTTESQTSQTPEPAAGDGQISAAAQEVLDACEAAAANVGAKEEDEALAIALSKTGAFADGMEGRYEVGVMNVLKNVRSALLDIRSLLEKRASAPAPAPALASPPTGEITRLRAKLDRDIQELYRESVLAEEAGQRAQHEHEQREEELRQRLQDVRRALDVARRNLHENQIQVASLKDEMSRARKNELRYKKKYHALKQEVQAAKRDARRNSPAVEDDSLIIL